MNFFTENLQAFKKIALPLFTLAILSNNVDQYLNIQVEEALRNPSGIQKSILIYGFLLIFFNIVFPVLMTTLALFSLFSLKSKAMSLSGFIDKHLNQLFIETLRAWGKTLLWSMVFLLPGIWKYLHYSLVPFVVAGSPLYREGRVDALQASTSIVSKHRVKVLGIFILFHLFIPIVLSALFDAYRLIWKTPLASLLLSLLDTYLLIISTHLLFKIFTSEVKQDDSYV